MCLWLDTVELVCTLSCDAKPHGYFEATLGFSLPRLKFCSTSSMTAMGAASPARLRVGVILVYPPFRVVNRGAIWENKVLTTLS